MDASWGCSAMCGCSCHCPPPFPLQCRTLPCSTCLCRRDGLQELQAERNAQLAAAVAEQVAAVAAEEAANPASKRGLLAPKRKELPQVVDGEGWASQCLLGGVQIVLAMSLACIATTISQCPTVSYAPMLLSSPPQPGEHLKETVELLAGCRPAEVALLQSLAGYRKLLMTWR